MGNIAKFFRKCNLEREDGETERYTVRMPVTDSTW